LDAHIPEPQPLSPDVVLFLVCRDWRFGLTWVHPSDSVKFFNPVQDSLSLV